ncbi:hypothetical protein Sste5346_006263 [Sporothrix stenoceras]|uniref:Uncharacterized protein n=1 Tax=Sporothrix stenoceras TaxID=5173 RepID=A0ABR3Z122_9PEZI
MPQIPTSDKERGPRSLKRMALAVALRNIASITDVGEMAFADAKPILTHIENPHQLYLLETNCPQLAAEPDQMAAVWGRLLTKKVPGWDTKGFLTDEELQTMSWIDIYTTVKSAIDAEMAAAEDRLRQTLAGFSKAKEDNSTQLVNNRALTRKIPGVMTKKRGPGADRSQAVLNFGSGSRTKMTSGQSVLRRARREAKEISKVSQLSSRLTENQAVARSQIRRAPAAMMHDHRVAHQPGTGIIRPPKKRLVANPSSEVKTHYETEGRYGAPGTGLGVGNASNEARLLALKTGGVAAASTATSYSAGPAAPAIHAPRKRAATSTMSTNASSSEKSREREKRRTYDHDEDDELFGVVTKPSKRARLTIEDIEGGGSGNDDGDLFGSDEEPSSKPKSKARPVVSSSSRDRDDYRERSDQRDDRRERDRRDDRRDDGRDDRSYDRSYDSPPKKSSVRPSVPISSSTYKPPPLSASAGSPPRAQAVGGGGPPRKKAVDIFMRPKRK